MPVQPTCAANIIFQSFFKMLYRKGFQGNNNFVASQSLSICASALRSRPAASSFKTQYPIEATLINGTCVVYLCSGNKSKKAQGIRPLLYQTELQNQYPVGVGQGRDRTCDTRSIPSLRHRTMFIKISGQQPISACGDLNPN